MQTFSSVVRLASILLLPSLLLLTAPTTAFLGRPKGGKQEDPLEYCQLLRVEYGKICHDSPLVAKYKGTTLFGTRTAVAKLMAELREAVVGAEERNKLELDENWESVTKVLHDPFGGEGFLSLFRMTAGGDGKFFPSVQSTSTDCTSSSSHDQPKVVSTSYPTTSSSYPSDQVRAAFLWSQCLQRREEFVQNDCPQTIWGDVLERADDLSSSSAGGPSCAADATDIRLIDSNERHKHAVEFLRTDIKPFILQAKDFAEALFIRRARLRSLQRILKMSAAGAEPKEEDHSAEITSAEDSSTPEVAEQDNEEDTREGCPSRQSEEEQTKSKDQKRRVKGRRPAKEQHHSEAVHAARERIAEYGKWEDKLRDFEAKIMSADHELIKSSGKRAKKSQLQQSRQYEREQVALGFEILNWLARERSGDTNATRTSTESAGGVEVAPRIISYQALAKRLRAESRNSKDTSSATPKSSTTSSPKISTRETERELLKSRRLLHHHATYMTESALLSDNAKMKEAATAQYSERYADWLMEAWVRNQEQNEAVLEATGARNREELRAKLTKGVADYAAELDAVSKGRGAEFWMLSSLTGCSRLPENVRNNVETIVEQVDRKVEERKELKHRLKVLGETARTMREERQKRGLAPLGSDHQAQAARDNAALRIGALEHQVIKKQNILALATHLASLGDAGGPTLDVHLCEEDVLRLKGEQVKLEAQLGSVAEVGESKESRRFRDALADFQVARGDANGLKYACGLAQAGDSYIGWANERAGVGAEHAEVFFE